MKKNTYFCMIFGEIGKKINGGTVENVMIKICTEEIKFKLKRKIPRTITKQRMVRKV